MEILIPLIMLEVAIALLVVGFILNALTYDEGAAICFIVALIMFFVGGTMFIDITETVSYPSYYENGTLRYITYDTLRPDYRYMCWLSVIMGFIPLLALYGLIRGEEE